MSGSTKPNSGIPQVLDPVGVDNQPLYPVASRRDRTHELVDRLAGELILRHATGVRVLDLGRGAPLVTEWVDACAASQRVVDAVDLGRGSEIRLPFPSGAFDLVYSLRTLPHLGRDEASSEAAAKSLMAEVGRVLAVGGTALVQVENPVSLWGLYHGIRNPLETVERGPMVVESERGLTRFDTTRRFLRLLPPELDLIDLHGLRVLATFPHVLRIPLVGRLVERFEWFARDRPVLRGVAAHLLMALRRLGATRA